MNDADYHIVIANQDAGYLATVDEIPGFEAYENRAHNAIYLAQRRVGEHADARSGAAGKLINLINRTKP